MCEYINAPLQITAYYCHMTSHFKTLTFLCKQCTPKKRQSHFLKILRYRHWRQEIHTVQQWSKHHMHDVHIVDRKTPDILYCRTLWSLHFPLNFSLYLDDSDKYFKLFNLTTTVIFYFNLKSYSWNKKKFKLNNFCFTQKTDIIYESF